MERVCYTDCCMPLEMSGLQNGNYHKVRGIMYQFDAKIRYSEVDEEGYLSLNGIMNYLQDTSTFHSEACGSGIEELKKRDRVWVLGGWQITIYRRPRFPEEIRVITMPYDFKGILGYRCFEIRDRNNEVLVFANSIWCYMQISAMRPVRIAAEEIALFEPLSPPPAQIAERKVKTEPGGYRKEAFCVRKEHLDMNHHVNNGQYVAMAAEYLPESCVITQLRAEYRTQARLGDTIVPVVTENEQQITVILGDGDKKVYAVVAFMIERKKV